MRYPEIAEFGVDANGCPTERIVADGQEIILHYDDVPESDITTVRGLRCTTPLRTVIDLAVELSDTELDTMIRDCLRRGMFTVDDMRARLRRPDMAGRRGACAVALWLDG